MKPIKIPSKRRPEDIIKDQIVKFLKERGWYVKTTHGGMFQSGFPDIYATHKIHGPRWIEVKLPDMKGSRWTAAQEECFPAFAANGTQIWILTGATESEYRKLFHVDKYGKLHDNWLEYFMRKGM